MVSPRSCHRRAFTNLLLVLLVLASLTLVPPAITHPITRNLGSPDGTILVVPRPATATAWINGTVSPISAELTVNGGPVKLDYSGTYATFSLSVQSGTYDVVAKLSGYSTYNRTSTVASGQGLTLRIDLMNRGTIEGFVSPISFEGQVANITIAGVVLSVSVSTGHYNDTLLARAAPYLAVDSLVGHCTQYANVTVQPGITVWLNFSPHPVPAGFGCNGYVSEPQTGGASHSSVTILGLPSAEGYAVLGGIVALIIAVVAVGVLRTRRGKTAAPPGESSPPVEHRVPPTPP
ncbi:MAG: hypothetical protein L3J97_01810 [Thermoplasmata archaeon]|nr:hypothetical protein [Thermoplasmata archaeon]